MALPSTLRPQHPLPYAPKNFLGPSTGERVGWEGRMWTAPSAWFSSLGASLPLSLSAFSSQVSESLSLFVSFCLSLRLRVRGSQALWSSVSLFSLNLCLLVCVSFPVFSPSFFLLLSLRSFGSLYISLCVWLSPHLCPSLLVSLCLSLSLHLSVSFSASLALCPGVSLPFSSGESLLSCENTLFTDAPRPASAPRAPG